MPGSNKDENRWQGKVRVGPLDMVALRYAINASGGPEFFDGIALSWFDQIQKIGTWDICNCYSNINDKSFFSPNGDINVHHASGIEQLEYQERLGNVLDNCKPIIQSNSIITDNQDELVDMCSNVIEQKLQVPLRMISFGATEKNKICI